MGRLHRDGLLTDEEFAMTKAAVPQGYRRRETRILDPGARPGS
ncbi:hypothetical protein [Streptomyces sp. NPDC003393]